MPFQISSVSTDWNPSIIDASVQPPLPTSRPRRDVSDVGVPGGKFTVDKQSNIDLVPVEISPENQGPFCPAMGQLLIAVNVNCSIGIFRGTPPKQLVNGFDTLDGRQYHANSHEVGRPLGEAQPEVTIDD